MSADRSIAIYYEHPDWFRPLFAELERRGVPHLRIDAARHAFDPAEYASPPFALLFNRMSPSAWKRGHAGAIVHTLEYLTHLESREIQVVNGADAFAIEISKVRQIDLIERLGFAAPRTRVVNRPEQLYAASRELRFPLVVKPNIGGSGAGIVRFDTLHALVRAIDENRIAPGIDGLILVQEFHSPKDCSIVRVETLAGRYLYAIRVHIEDGAGFDLCPADLCRTVDGATLESSACPVGAAKAGLTIERFHPPEQAVRAVERIARAAQLDVGGIEYLESARDERTYFYDVNALSNFVPDPVRVVGFDPTARLVDELVRRLERIADRPAAVAPPVDAAPASVGRRSEAIAAAAARGGRVQL